MSASTYTIIGLEDDTKFIDWFITDGDLTHVQLRRRVRKYIDEQRPDAEVIAVIKGKHHEECYL